MLRPSLIWRPRRHQRCAVPAHGGAAADSGAGSGEQPLQPVHISDVVATILRALTGLALRRALDIVGHADVLLCRLDADPARGSRLARGRLLRVPYRAALAMCRLVQRCSRWRRPTTCACCARAAGPTAGPSNDSWVARCAARTASAVRGRIDPLEERMSYTALKTLHILSMVLLFGTGLGSAFCQVDGRPQRSRGAHRRDQSARGAGRLDIHHADRDHPAADRPVDGVRGGFAAEHAPGSWSVSARPWPAPAGCRWVAADPDAQAGGCGGSTGAGSAGRLLAPGAVVVLARRAGVHRHGARGTDGGKHVPGRRHEEPDATGLGRSVGINCRIRCKRTTSRARRWTSGTWMSSTPRSCNRCCSSFPTWAHWFVVAQGRCRRAWRSRWWDGSTGAARCATPDGQELRFDSVWEPGPAGHGGVRQSVAGPADAALRGRTAVALSRRASSPEWGAGRCTSPSGWRSDTPRSWSAQSTNTTSRWTSGWSIRCSGRCSAIRGRSGQMQARTPASQRLDFDLGSPPSAKGYATSSMRPQ